MVKTIFKGGFDDNFTYLLCSENGDCAVIDPCGDCTANLKAMNIPPDSMKYILITHSHSDHFDALDEVKKIFPAAKVAAHKQAELIKDILLDDSSELEFGSSIIEVLHTPGHSRDSLCYIYKPDNALFTGDTVFISCTGFCRSPKTMAQSLERICNLPDELIIYSGHDYGEVPSRSLKEEKVKNPELSAEFIAKLRSEHT